VLTSGVDQVRPGQDIKVAGAGRGEGRGARSAGARDSTRRDTTRRDTSRRR